MEALPLIASRRWGRNHITGQGNLPAYSLAVDDLNFPCVGPKAKYVGGSCAERLDITSDVGR
jgi:hypothetical protein